MTRPASPLPCTRLRSTLCLRAAFRAVGVDARLLAACLRVGRLHSPRRAGAAAAAFAAVRLPPPLPTRRGVLDHAQHLADLHVVAVLAIDALRDAGLGRGDLEVDLVGLELDQRIADRDGVPFLAQPLRDARVDDRFADFRNDDVRRH